MEEKKGVKINTLEEGSKRFYHFLEPFIQFVRGKKWYCSHSKKSSLLFVFAVRVE